MPLVYIIYIITNVNFYAGPGTGVSILSKNQVFYKGGYESLEFFIRRHYVVFTKNKVVVYKKSAFFVRCVRFHDIQ